MKKKLFLIFCLVAAICVALAISVGAKTITTIDGTEVEVTIYDDAPVKSTFVNSTNDYVIFDDGFACPSSYIFKDQASIPNGGWQNPSLPKVLDFEYIKGKTGKS